MDLNYSSIFCVMMINSWGLSWCSIPLKQIDWILSATSLWITLLFFMYWSRRMNRLLLCYGSIFIVSDSECAIEKSIIALSASYSLNNSSSSETSYLDHKLLLSEWPLLCRPVSISSYRRWHHNEVLSIPFNLTI